MTQVAIGAIELDGDRSKVLHTSFSKVMEGACNADGSWKRGWQLPTQSGVKHESVGVYTVTHNLGTLKYAASATKLSPMGGAKFIELSVNTAVIEIRDENQELQDSAFRFALNMYDGS